MMDKQALLGSVSIICESIGEKDLARLAKFKELCIKYHVREQSALAISNELYEWEKSYD